QFPNFLPAQQQILLEVLKPSWLLNESVRFMQKCDDADSHVKYLISMNHKDTKTQRSPSLRLHDFVVHFLSGLGFKISAACSASCKSINPSSSLSIILNCSGVPRNSLRETSPSALRSILRNQSGPRRRLAARITAPEPGSPSGERSSPWLTMI